MGEIGGPRLSDEEAFLRHLKQKEKDREWHKKYDAEHKEEQRQYWKDYPKGLSSEQYELPVDKKKC